jgi:hypothetical protein
VRSTKSGQPYFYQSYNPCIWLLVTKQSGYL